MWNRTLWLGALCSLGLTWTVAGAADLPAGSHWLPADTAIALEVEQPSALLEPLLSPEVAKATAALPLAEDQKLKLQALRGMVAYLELQLGTDWRTGLRGLLGQAVTVGVAPSGAAVLSADAQDEKLLQKLNETVRAFAAGAAAKAGRPEPVTSKAYHGTTTWSFGTNETHALLGRRLLLANRPQLLQRVLDLRADSHAANLAATPFYQAARQAVGTDTVASVFLNLQTLRQNPQLQKMLAGDANPLAALVLTDGREALRDAHWLAIGLRVKDGQLELQVRTDGQAAATSKWASFSSPAKPEEGALPELEVPGCIARFSAYRDLRRFYEAKDELFPERSSGLVFFENMMGIFFSGKELTQGVLGQTRPDVRIVVAEQRYDPAIGTPAVQVPAFAVVLRLRDPAAFSDTVEEAWQKALGLVNFTRGQQALPGLVLDRVSHGGVKYTVAAYRPPGAPGKAPVEDRYNYRPTLARPGDYVIFSSTDALACDLIDALQKEAAAPPQPLSGGHSFGEIDAARLRATLVANQESLVQKNMLEKGHTHQQAEAETRGLLTFLDSLERVSFTLGREQGHPQATVKLKLKLPSAAAGSTTAMMSK